MADRFQRDRIEIGPLDKLEVQRIVGTHLGMYLPTQSPDVKIETKIQVETKVEYEETETLRSIKEEDEDEETLVDIQEIKSEARL